MARWASTADVLAQAACADYVTDGGTTGDLNQYIDAASEVLFVRSGRQFGTRTVTVRPCRSCSCGHDSARRRIGEQGWSTPAWSSASCCTCGPEQLTLGLGAIIDVVTVKIDGVTLTEGVDFRLDEGTYLVRLPAAGTTTKRTWPTWQRIDLADTEDDTFSVTVLLGPAVPQMGVLAAAELACKLSGMVEDSCTDPPNATAKTRQGVSYDLVSFAEALVNGSLGGLPLCDLFLGTFNPHKLARRARVLFPPVCVPRRTDVDGPS